MRWPTPSQAEFLYCALPNPQILLFGDWAPFAPGLKSLEDAIEIRRRILLAFELAESETDPAERRRLMTFVVIGAGPTGVEGGLEGNIFRGKARVFEGEQALLDALDRHPERFQNHDMV